VTALQSREPSMPVIAELIETFAANSVVKILSGVFAGRTGRVVQSAQKSTSIVVEAFSGRETTVTLATTDLVAS
jgi:transcription antitermination factor NusG